MPLSGKLPKQFDRHLSAAGFEVSIEIAADTPEKAKEIADIIQRALLTRQVPAGAISPAPCAGCGEGKA